MKRLALLLATSATLLVPAVPALAAPARADEVRADALSIPTTAAAHVDGVSKIPPQYCLAILGSDFERLACSSS
jgi:hypothetical protein